MTPRRRLLLLMMITCLLCTFSAFAVTVKVDTAPAKAVLKAIQNPDLSHDEALTIARMPGNQGVIRKLVEFKIAATTDAFADALYRSAHDQPPASPVETSFYFAMVKPKARQLQQLIQTIEANPANFNGAIAQRIAMFTPPNAKITLVGYVVAGGDGGGYAFGGNDFYLNIGIIDELVVAKSVTTHELYHAVQGALAPSTDGKDEDFVDGTTPAMKCRQTAHLFKKIYDEGSAVYVSDISVLNDAHSESGLRIKNDLFDGIKHVQLSDDLLEMSITSLTAPRAVPFDEVYDVGFFGHAVLYNIGYVMAKAIADEDGPAGLAAFLTRPPYAFVLRYTQLHKYGLDAEHPKLGPNTIDALNAVAAGCK